MRLTLLGTGTPGPNPDRLQSAVLVEIGSHVLLFDAGRGAVQQMARVGVAIERVDPVFITHHHADHIGDLYDVILTSALCGRTRPLRIFGPAGTADIVRALLESVYDRDIRSRIAHEDNLRHRGLPASSAAEAIARVECRDVQPGIVAATEPWRVTADQVRHGDYDDAGDLVWRCLGYRIEAEGQVIAISGDTVPCDGLLRLADGADLLVQCCHFPASGIVDEVGRYMTQTTLPSADQVGEIAAEAKVKHLVLTHISMHVSTPEMQDELRRDVRRAFPGRVTVGADLLAFDLRGPEATEESPNA